jgi:hypothetical protein
MSTTAFDVDPRERAPPSEQGVLDLAQYTLEQVRTDAEFVLFRGHPLRQGAAAAGAAQSDHQCDRGGTVFSFSVPVNEPAP